MRDLHIQLSEGTYTNGLGYRVQFQINESTITGNHVLVNKVLKKLLTAYNTDAFAPTSGSDIKVYLQGSNVNDIVTLSQTITTTLKTITEDIKAGETEFYPVYFNTDPSMQLNHIALSDIYKKNSGYDSVNSGIVMELLITAMDGSFAEVKLNIDDTTNNTENDLAAIRNKIYDYEQREAAGLN